MPLGKTEKIVQVNVTVSKSIGSAYDYLATNAIPGKIFFYELVKIILSKYYAIEYNNSVKEFFKKCYAYEANAELYDSASNKHFDELPSFKVKVRKIYPTKIRERLRMIEQYAKMGPPFPSPIYIQEKILESVIGKSSRYEDIIMVDGARRIIAGCVCKLREMKVVLITKEKLKS